MEIDLLGLSSPLPEALTSPEQMAFTITQFFTSEVYAYCIFDVITILARAKAMNATELITSPGRLLTSPYRLIANPAILSHVLGDERHKVLSVVLDSLWQEHEASLRSVAKTCEQTADAAEDIATFLRGVALCSAVHHPFALQVGYVLQALLTDGEISPRLYLTGDYPERCVTLSSLALLTAKEFGSLPLLHASVGLLRQGGLPVDYRVAKQIGAGVSRSDRRALDWTLKVSGNGKTLSRRKGWVY